jgi:hypothetical protein
MVRSTARNNTYYSPFSRGPESLLVFVDWLFLVCDSPHNFKIVSARTFRSLRHPPLSAKYVVSEIVSPLLLVLFQRDEHFFFLTMAIAKHPVQSKFYRLARLPRTKLFSYQRTWSQEVALVAKEPSR